MKRLSILFRLVILFSWIASVPAVQAAIVPDSGQTKCYDTTGAEISCAGTGQDGELTAGVTWPSPRFTANADLSITDNLTGLAWGNDGNLPGAAACNPGVTKSWLDAMTYVSCLNQTGYLGHNDWRLPSILELRSLINYGQLKQSTWLTTAGFTAIKDFDYWSSTSNVNTPSTAFSLNMGSGGITNTLSKTTASYALPVRGGSDAITAVPSSHSFSSITINSQSTAKEFQIINGGTNSIIVSGISIAGGNPTQFAVATGGSSPCASLTPTLTANSSCTVTVAFAPTISGPKSALLTITSNSVSRPTFDIPITGIATTTTIIPESDSGQTKCYDTAGLEISCAGTGQDGELRAGVTWPNPRFSPNADLSMTDNLTGLIWVNDGNLPGPADCAPGVTKNWLDALLYVTCLNQNNYRGHDDWRLPSILELRSLINYGQSKQSTWLIAGGFAAIKEFDYWSSTSSAETPSAAWALNMGTGGITSAVAKTTATYALPVRGGINSASLLPLLHSFGTVIIGTSSPEMEFRITNSGDSAITVSGISISGSTPTEYVLTLGGSSPCVSLTPTLAAGANCTVKVAFVPTSVGAKSAALQVTSNDATRPTLFTVLSGNGVIQTYTITTAVIGTGGTITCDSSVNISTSSTCTLSPSTGYVLEALTDNSSDVKNLIIGNLYTISNVTANHMVAVTFADLVAPTISTFTIPASTTTLAIAITAFTATDNVAVSGYCLSEINDSNRCTWTTIKPTNYTFTSAAITRLYAFAKDAAGTISSSASATIAINLPDFTTPTITTFTLPTTATTLTVPITFTATDNTAVTGYCLTETNNSTSCTWATTVPANYTFATAGSKTLYAFAKDAAGNISASKSASVTITTSDTTAPTISTFTLPPTATTLTVPITTFTATDNTAVTGYCLSETNNSTACTWTATAPANYIFTTAGNKILYAFAKDATGNISASANSGTIITLATVDSTPPTLAITAPLQNATLSSITQISGTASDADSQVAKVEVQIGRGTGIYLQNDDRWGTVPQWIVASGTAAWNLPLLNVVWTEGAVYTVRARAYDSVGNVSPETTATFNYSSSSASLAYTTVSINLSAQTILQQGNITISGTLNRLPDNGSSMKGKTVSLSITKPDGTLVTPAYSTQTSTDLGDFTFSGLAVFDQKGSYSIQTSFSGSATLSESSSTLQTLLVGSQAGYAVIVQGKIASGEGLADHNKITNRIYSALKTRGFDDSNILYYNYNTAQSGVDGLPDKTTVMNAITGMASRINGSPAPFYLIMVDHGLADTFYLGNETVTPADVNSWLTTLESNLTSTAKAEARLIILGFCYSGSFIPALSAPGRIVITSATATEESIRGPLENDNIRSGELFLDDMFQKLSKGSSLSDSFGYAATTIRMKARKDNSYISAYGDGSVQHPLIADGSDKTGAISAAGLSTTLYLGAGATMTNSVNPEDITSVAPTTFLTATDNQIQLSLYTFGTADAAWAEVRLPNYNISTGSSSGQLVIDLPRILLTRDPADSKHWSGTANLSNLYQVNPPVELPSGSYEIYYSASATGTISAITRAVAYKNKSVNAAPTVPHLLTPLAGEKVKTMTVFSWAASSDADGDAISYTLTIKDALGNVVHQQEELPVTSSYIPDGILKDASTYTWYIQAIDQYGATTAAAPQTITTDNTNGLPGIIKGYLRSTAGMPIADATISSGTSTYTTLRNGAFLFMTQPGSYTINAAATGYQTRSVVGVSVTAGKVLDASMSLTAAAITTTKAGDCDSDGTITIADVQSAINMFLGLKAVQACVDQDATGAVTIAEVQKVINSFLGL
jgi:hypothetical protein